MTTQIECNGTIIIDNRKPQSLEAREKPRRFRNIVTDGSRTLAIAEYSGTLLSQQSNQLPSANTNER